MPPVQSRPNRGAAGGAAPAPKRPRARRHFDVEPGTLYTWGTNGEGQLGLMDFDERNFPTLNGTLIDEKIVAISCGGMHTVVLTTKGQVFTFGVNDEHALGRDTAADVDDNSDDDDDGNATPGRVEIQGFVTQISAGGSHSAALTEDGRVFLWGTFRDKNGQFGLLPRTGREGSAVPVELRLGDLGIKATKLASGKNHIVILGDDEKVYTLGVGNEGQLGRISAQEAKDSQSENVTPAMRNFLKVLLLTPAPLNVSRSLRFENIWTGPFATFAKLKNDTKIYVCGRNSDGQLGLPVRQTFDPVFRPTLSGNLSGHSWKMIAAGEGHTVCLSNGGRVYTLGCNKDGLLGLGDEDKNVECINRPMAVDMLTQCETVAAGSSTAYAVNQYGELFAWGFGFNGQLATGDDENRNLPTRCKEGRKKEGIRKKVVLVDAGMQHAALTTSLKPKKRTPSEAGPRRRSTRDAKERCYRGHFG